MIRRDTREMIREFQLAFERPVNDAPVDNLPIADRELLGKLLLEETLEFCKKGLGLDVYVCINAATPDNEDLVSVRHHEGVALDHIEAADGLGDVNVVVHFCAHWMGYDLDHVTTEIHNSNMSKLGEDGKPIINGETPGYRAAQYHTPTGEWDGHGVEPRQSGPEAGFDPTRPVGKILKGPNFAKPDIAAVIFF